VIETKGARAKTVSTWSLANVKALVQEYIRESVSPRDRLKTSQTRESLRPEAQTTLVQLVKEQRADCLTVRQIRDVNENLNHVVDSVDKKICVSQGATDLSQTEAGFETDLSHQTGPLIYKTQDTRLQNKNNPLPPSKSKGECFDESAKEPWERSACAAVQRVKSECDWSDRRLDPVIEEALRAHCQKFGAADLAVSAGVMTMGWSQYLKHKHLLRYQVGERKFITRGWWLSDSVWPWDEKLLEQRRRL
jgi:hypothetical protein